jgi:hypothetical protein
MPCLCHPPCFDRSNNTKIGKTDFKFSRQFIVKADLVFWAIVPCGSRLWVRDPQQYPSDGPRSGVGNSCTNSVAWFDHSHVSLPLPSPPTPYYARSPRHAPPPPPLIFLILYLLSQPSFWSTKEASFQLTRTRFNFPSSSRGRDWPVPLHPSIRPIYLLPPIKPSTYTTLLTSALMMEAVCSSETSATQPIPHSASTEEQEQ